MNASAVVNAQLGFCTMAELPKESQSDRGFNFLSNPLQQALEELGVKHVRSSAYYPEYQGALERYHQTLKQMMRKYCLEHIKDWVKGVAFLLFAIREVPQESFGFYPNELVFAHHVRGPLSIVMEARSSDVETSKNFLKCVLKFKTRLSDLGGSKEEP